MTKSQQMWYKFVANLLLLLLKLLFETALKEKKFPDMCKLVNVIPVHNKEEKNC